MEGLSLLGEAVTGIDENLYQDDGYVSIGGLVALLAEHRLVRNPLRLYFLHELVLGEHAFFYQ